MALKDIRGFMAKKPHPTPKKEEVVHVTVESWQWKTPPSRRFTWKHWLILAVLIAVAALLALGFILIAGVVLIIALVLNLVFYVFKKLT